MNILKILVPLDGSELSEAAIANALEIAPSSTVILTRVTDLAELSHEYSAIAVTSLLEEMKDECEDYLDSKLKELSQRKVKAEAVPLIGNPAKLIVELARERDVDLIVISSHGRSGLRRWFLGSVAEEVMRRSPVPVLLLPQGTGLNKPASD